MAYVRIISPDVQVVDDLAFVDLCIFHQLALLLNCRSDGVIVCCGVVGYLRSYRRDIPGWRRCQVVVNLVQWK